MKEKYQNEIIGIIRAKGNVSAAELYHLIDLGESTVRKL
jgi:DeoR/GlpR family transcriptional regulator of sugar metabolism